MEKAKQSGTTLPTDSKERKGIPMARGLLDYFPDALAAVARLSVLGNEKHNPGEPLHWSREKSSDHADCAVRHLVERGRLDTESYSEPVRHSTEAAWRVLALLQLEIEEDFNQVAAVRREFGVAAARDAFFDSAEHEYLDGHGMSVLKRHYPDNEPYPSDPDCRTSVDPWPYSQKDWKPKAGG